MEVDVIYNAIEMLEITAKPLTRSTDQLTLIYILIHYLCPFFFWENSSRCPVVDQRRGEPSLVA